MSNTLETMTNLYTIIGMVIVGIFFLIAFINAAWQLYQRIVGVREIHQALQYYRNNYEGYKK